MKKGSLFKSSLIRMTVLGIVILIGVCICAGCLFFRQNKQFYTELAYSFVRLGTMNIDGDKVNEIIENREFFEEFFADRDDNFIFEPEANEKDRIEDPGLNELMKYWFEVEAFITTTSVLHDDIVYFYVVIPTEDKLIYLWDSDHKNGNVTRPFEEDVYAAHERENLISAYSGKWEEKLVLYRETRMTYGTAMSPVVDGKGNVVAVCALDISITDIIAGFWKLMLNIAVIVVLIMLVSMLIYFVVLKRRVITPIEKLEQAASGMVDNLKDDNYQPMTIDINSEDEIGALAHSFEEMGESLKEYIDENARITAERERIGTELSLAARIQEGMLPREFPPFPDRKEFDI